MGLAMLHSQMRYSLFVAALFLANLSFGQNEEAGKQSEASGRYRDALEHYKSAMEKIKEYNADYQRLAEAALRVARRMSPPPEIPEAARNHMIRGRTAFRIAQSSEDLKEAAKEFDRAVAAAPWWPDAYFNLALAKERRAST